MLVAVDRVGPLQIGELAEIHGSAYELRKGAESVRVLFKIATSRAGRNRWQFTVGSAELEVVRSLNPARFPFFLALVCQKDGVCCIPHPALLTLISETHSTAQSISVSREHRGRYWVSGPGGATLPASIPVSDWPLRLFTDKP